MAPTPVLGYWHLRGLAQPIRLMLKYAGIKFEDKYYEYGPAPDYNNSSWLKDKNSLGLELPNLPYYIEGDVKLAQSKAIIRHIARKNNLEGRSEAEKDRIEQITEDLEDWRQKWFTFAYTGSKDSESDYLKQAHEHLQAYSKFLGENEWFAGKHLSWADFVIYEFLDQHRVLQANILANYTNLQQFMDCFEQMPSMKDYMQSSEFIKYPVMGKTAHWGG